VTIWIGGASGAGKSTIARRLARSQGLRLYDTDAVMPDHARRCDGPYLRAFAAMDMDERWLTRSPELMLETFHWYRGEGFDLILDDLAALPPGTDVVVEGFRLLPHLVPPGRAVWLLPTPEFRRAAFESRGGLWTIAGRTSNPAQALDNLLTRDAMFTDRLRAETARLNLPTIDVHIGMTEDDLYTQVLAAL
jgi:hypothetical protein